MKVKRRYDVYVNLARNINRKIAIDWCMKFLWVDIDCMSPTEFIDLVTEYEEYVAYPLETSSSFFGEQGIFWEDLPILSRLTTPCDEEIKVRDIFKAFQKKAIKRFNALREMKYTKHNNGFSEVNKLSFAIDVDRNREFRFWPEDVHDFEYSFLWHLGRFLSGYKFSHRIKKCPICGHYFALTTKHHKECCSPKCSVRHNNNKIYKKNPVLARKKGNLESHYSVLKKYGHSEFKQQLFLRDYIKQRKYKPQEIPDYIKKFLNNKF